MKSLLVNDMADGDINITAIEKKPERFRKLQDNLSRYGINADCLMMDATLFDGQLYDRVLVDAPCSREGMVTKYDHKRGTHASGFDSVILSGPAKVSNYNDIQQRLLQNGFRHLKPGGNLVYVTCTMNMAENEDVVYRFLEKNPDARTDLQDIQVPNHGLLAYDHSNDYVRIFPSVNSRGLFFTRITKA
jgi:16S rRNA (cytosine967-C5)-methyltransferase